jgi:hypothetical protein
VKGSVAVGDSYKFTFDLHAPSTPGTYFEYFNLVEEGVAWFSDPGQGGPPDDDLEVQIVVVAGPDTPAAEGGKDEDAGIEEAGVEEDAGKVGTTHDAGTTRVDAGTHAVQPEDAGSGASWAASAAPGGGSASGGCAMARGAGDGRVAWVLALGAMGWAARMRRRGRRERARDRG